MTPAQMRWLAALSAAMVASGIAATETVGPFEGWVSKTYADPAHGWDLPTGCLGATKGIERGRTYTDRECVELLARDLTTHALEIAPCLPEQLPDKTRAAFVSFAFNVGSTKACSSTMFRKARAGDLAGACDELLRWNRATVNGKSVVLRGLTRRREAERQLCREGLAHGSR